MPYEKQGTFFKAKQVALLKVEAGLKADQGSKSARQTEIQEDS